MGVYLGDGRLDRYIGMEEEPRHGGAPKRHGFDVLDPVYRRGERPLSDGHDPVLHLSRGEPAVAPDHVDDRNVDSRKDVYGHGDDGQNAQDSDQQGEHHESVRTAEGKTYNPHDAT